MTPEQYDGLMDRISSQIKETVNGKIDRLTLENREQGNKLDEYIKADNIWKDKAQPIIDLGNSARGASQAALWLAGAVITLGGAWEIIRSLFKK